MLHIGTLFKTLIADEAENHYSITASLPGKEEHCWPTTPNIVGCYMLRPFVWNRSNFSANNSQHFFCSAIAEAERNNVRSVCTALPTLLGPRTVVTHGVKRLMGCILPTVHCRSQHCWELLHPFAHHYQHARNNSQHCWCNNVGSCCVRLHAALGNITARWQWR